MVQRQLAFRAKVVEAVDHSPRGNVKRSQVLQLLLEDDMWQVVRLQGKDVLLIVKEEDLLAKK